MSRHVEGAGRPDRHRQRFECADGQRRGGDCALPLEVEATEEGPAGGVRRGLLVRAEPRVDLEAERLVLGGQDVQGPDRDAAPGQRIEAVDGVDTDIEHDPVLSPSAFVCRRQLVQGGALRGRRGEQQGGQQEGGDAAAAAAAIDHCEMLGSFVPTEALGGTSNQLSMFESTNCTVQVLR